MTGSSRIMKPPGSEHLPWYSMSRLLEFYYVLNMSVAKKSLYLHELFNDQSMIYTFTGFLHENCILAHHEIH